MPSVADIFRSPQYGPAPESPAPALDWLDAHNRSFGHFIGGSWTSASSPEEGPEEGPEQAQEEAPEARNGSGEEARNGSGEGAGGEAAASFETRNPATGELLARVRQGTEADVAAAVAAAKNALPAWRALGGQGRARVLYALARGIQKHSRLLAVLESLDNGKPIRESRDLDIPLVARHFHHHAGWAALVEEEFPDREPHGVVGQIIPWNFPLLMLAWKVAPALACGNTVVLKPAEYTPLTALCFADLCREAGVPPGVVNIVTGDGRTGAAVAAHPEIRKVAFTGSTEVGRILRRETAGTGKALTLELGGKSPFLVYDDADLDSVVEGVVDAIWFNQGEVCCAGSRILVQESVAERLVAKLRARMETLRLGDPLDKGIDMGAVVHRVQLDRIRELVARGREEGAQVWQPSWTGNGTGSGNGTGQGGSQAEPEGSETADAAEEGAFFPPTLCTNVEPAGTLAQVEIFGPVVVLMTFRTHDESVALANNTRYGLAASVWTENVNLALDVAPRLEAGTVWINCTNVFDAASGFGGVRESGFGREGGREGLLAYLRPRPPAETDARGETDAHTPATEVRTSPALGPLPGGSSAPAPAPGSDGETAPTEEPLGPTGYGLEGSSPILDRTPKLYIGRKQARPDGGTSLGVVARDGGTPFGVVGRGNRKDIRNAVEAAVKAFPGWSGATAHLRAQILHFLAENLAVRAEEFETRLREEAGLEPGAAAREVTLSVERLFTWGAWADKVDGRVHATPFRNVTLAMVEPVGIVGIAAPDSHPLLGLVSAVAPAVALGNTVVAVPSQSFPLSATDLYQVLDTSDLPAGVVNVVTGLRSELVPVLADHDGVDAVWSFGDSDEAREVELRSVGNLKRTWAPVGGAEPPLVWSRPRRAQDERFIEHATRVKNIWIPYGA